MTPRIGYHFASGEAAAGFPGAVVDLFAQDTGAKSRRSPRVTGRAVFTTASLIRAPPKPISAFRGG
jgi:hypothetical protein